MAGLVRVALTAAVALLTVWGAAADVCTIKGSNIVNIYLNGVDFGFICTAGSGDRGNVAIHAWSPVNNGTVLCSAANITSPFVGCRTLQQSTRYYGDVTGTWGYSRTDFYTPGDCRISSYSVNCATKQTTFGCTTGSRVVVEVLDSNSVTKYLYLNVTTPFIVPDGLVNGDTVIMTALDPTTGSVTWKRTSCDTLPTFTPAPPARTPTPARTVQPAQQGVPGGAGQSVGDPHVTTLDGLTITYLNPGDQIMLRTEDGFQYQARHCSFQGEGSSTCAVAVKCSVEGDHIELHADTPRLRAFMAGQELKLSKLKDGVKTGVDATLRRTAPRALDIECSSGFKLSIVVHESTEFMYFDTKVLAPDAFKGHTSGLMGQWDDDDSNDVSFSNGEVWNPGHGLSHVTAVEYPELSEVQASWNVPPGESLFSLEMKKSRTATEAQSRRRLNSLKEAADDPALRMRAQGFCNRLGLTGKYLTMCMFDYFSTGDEVFVANIIESRRYFGVLLLPHVRRMNAADDPALRMRAQGFCNRLGLTGKYLTMCMFDYFSTGDEVFVANIIESRRFFGVI